MSANIFDLQLDLDDLQDGQSVDLEPTRSVPQDNLLNAVWKPEESDNPAILLISSGNLSILTGTFGYKRQLSKNDLNFSHL